MRVVFSSQSVTHALLSPHGVTGYKEYFVQWTEICPILENLLVRGAVLKFSIFRKSESKLHCNLV